VSRAAERPAARRARPVVEWGVDPVTAAQRPDAHRLSFVANDDGPDVYDVRVDRTAQLAAIRAHASQLDDDPVVCKVLALRGDTDRVRIRRPRQLGDGG
jgi:hypothetical protein